MVGRPKSGKRTRRSSCVPNVCRMLVERTDRRLHGFFSKVSRKHVFMRDTRVCDLHNRGPFVVATRRMATASLRFLCRVLVAVESSVISFSL